jgi:ATP-dependent DNA ligase
VNGVLQKVCTVGGGFTDILRDDIWFNKQLYVGKVFEARGKILFTSGALRHPAFTDWRPDVKPEECTLRSV